MSDKEFYCLTCGHSMGSHNSDSFNMPCKLKKCNCVKCECIGADRHRFYRKRNFINHPLRFPFGLEGRK